MMRPQVRGDTLIPSWSNAACIRHSPISGFSCSLRISLAISSVTTLGALRACDLSSSPLTPSCTQRFSVVYTVCLLTYGYVDTWRSQCVLHQPLLCRQIANLST